MSLTRRAFSETVQYYSSLSRSALSKNEKAHEYLLRRANGTPHQPMAFSAMFWVVLATTFPLVFATLTMVNVAIAIRSLVSAFFGNIHSRISSPFISRPRPAATRQPRQAPYDKNKKNTGKGQSNKPLNPAAVEQKVIELTSGTAAGMDRPWAKNRLVSGWPRCTVMTSDDTSCTLWEDCEYRLDEDSQNPKVLLKSPKNNGTFHITIDGEHMVVNKDQNGNPVDNNVIFKRLVGEMDLAMLTQLLADMQVTTTSPADITRLLAIYTTGIDGMSFALKDSVSYNMTIRCLKQNGKIKRPPPDDISRALLAELHQGKRVTILEKPREAEILHIKKGVWHTRIKAVFKNGIFPLFKLDEMHEIEQPDGITSWKSTLDLYLDGERPIPHIPHMEITEGQKALRESEDAKQPPIGDLEGNPIESKWASFPAKTFFTSLLEWRNTMLLCALKENARQRAIVGQVFNKNQLHKATVKKITGYSNSWYFIIKAKVPKGVSVPKIPTDTVFFVNTIQELAANTEMDVDQGQNSLEPPPAATMPIDRAMFVSEIRVDRTSFVLEYNAQKNEKVPWVDDAILEVALVMQVNQEATRRHVAAVRQVAAQGMTDQNRKILGHNLEPPAEISRLSDKIESLSDGLKKYLLSSLHQVKLNSRQMEAFDNVIDGTGVWSFIQGLPGTGKSFVISRIAISALILKSTALLLAAPSRTAATEVAMKCHRAMKQLPAFLRDSIDFTITPTKKQSEQMAIEYLGQREQSNTWSPEDGKCLIPYQLFYKCICDAKQNMIANPAINGDIEAVKKWNDNLAKMQRGEKLPDGDWDFWWRKTWERRGFVINKSTMIAGTCNNMATITSGGFLNRLRDSGLAIIDEAAFDQEYDIMVVLSLQPRQVLLVGDHAQLQPIVASRGWSEYSNQGELSLFERLSGSDCDSKFVMLVETYRFPERIGNFPGLIYGCLKSPPAEVYDNSDVWQAFSEWFNGTAYQAKRRAPLPVPQHYIHTDEADQFKLPRDNRRVFINVRGRSAKDPNSMSSINYANVYSIIMFCRNMTQDPAARNLNNNVVILVPFAAQLSEMSRQVALWLPDFPVQVSTIDSYQGKEQDIVLVCFSPANTNDGSRIGFLKTWNRINVAITRPKQALVIFGNLDLWRAHFDDMRKMAPKFTLFLLDLIDRGDIIDDIEPATHVLPVNEDELESGTWTLICPESPAGTPKGIVLPLPALGAPMSLSRFEEAKMADLYDLRRAAIKNLAELSPSINIESVIVKKLEDVIGKVEGDLHMFEDDSTLEELLCEN